MEASRWIAAGLAFLVVMPACSKPEPPRPRRSVSTELGDAQADIEDMKQALLANFSSTCEGAALAVVWSSSDENAKEAACGNWRVHGDPPKDAPAVLMKQSVLVWCASPKAYYAVRLGTGEVLSLADPTKPSSLRVDSQKAAAAAKACAHIYD